jgi:hypothetical protein
MESQSARIRAEPPHVAVWGKDYVPGTAGTEDGQREGEIPGLAMNQGPAKHRQASGYFRVGPATLSRTTSTPSTRTSFFN